MIDEAIFEKLCNQPFIEVDYEFLILLLQDMNNGRINTLSIQQTYENKYLIKVDEPTIRRYKDGR